MPPLSCAHVDVSWMSQNWPSAEGKRVTACAVPPATIANTIAQTKRFIGCPIAPGRDSLLGSSFGRLSFPIQVSSSFCFRLIADALSLESRGGGAPPCAWGQRDARLPPSAPAVDRIPADPRPVLGPA